MSSASALRLALSSLVVAAAIAAPAAAGTTRQLEPVRVGKHRLVFEVHHISAPRVRSAWLVVEVRQARRRWSRVLTARVSSARIRRAIKRRRALLMHRPRALRRLRRRRATLIVSLSTAARQRPKKGGTTSPSDPTSPTEPTSLLPTDPSTGCSPAFGEFSVGNWPAGCWRPYAVDSPINKPLPASPSLHANSAAVVKRILSMGTVGKLTGNIDPVYDYQVPY